MISCAGLTDVSFESETVTKEKYVSLLCFSSKLSGTLALCPGIVFQRIEVSQLLLKEKKIMEYYVLIMKLLTGYEIIIS